MTEANHRWIMSEGTFEHILKQDDLTQKMKGVVCYVPGDGAGAGIRRVRSTYVRDLDEIRNEIRVGRLSEGENIVFAIETGEDNPGGNTRDGQLLNLGETMARADDLCDSVGATLIAAPAGNILQVIDPNGPGGFDGMLENEIHLKCARHAMAVGVQAQQALANINAYTTYIRDVVSQIRDGGLGTLVMAGVTTNSPKQDPDNYPTAVEIFQAMDSVRSFVDGYWMNVPPHRDTGERDFSKARRAIRRFYGLDDV